MKKTLTTITWAIEKWSWLSLLAFFFRENLISAQVCSLWCVIKQQYGSLTEDKDWFCKGNKSGHVKKVTITTNNRIQAGFNSTRRNQLIIIGCTIRKYSPLKKCSKPFIPPQTDGMIRFSFNIGCSESKVIFKRRKKSKLVK